MNAARIALLIVALAGALAFGRLSGARRADGQSVRQDDLQKHDVADPMDPLLPGATISGRDAASVDASPPPPERATLDIIVMERGVRTPVARADVWILDDAMRSKTADSDGRVSIEVMPGLVLVGTYGSVRSRADGLIVLAYDHDTDEPSAETSVELAAGERAAVELFLHRGARITGHIWRPDGEPAANFTFAKLHAVGNGWSRPRPLKTDANGRFVLRGLEENWYLLAPDPKGHDVFAYEKVHALLGEHTDVTLTLKPGRLANVRVDVVQEGSGEPYPLPVTLQFVRQDGVADKLADKSNTGSARRRQGQAPFHFEQELRPATYRLRAELRGLWDERWGEPIIVLAPDWVRTVRVDVGEDLADPVVRVVAPATGPIAEVQCQLTRPFGVWSKKVMVRYTDGSGESRIRGLLLVDEHTTSTLLVDLHDVMGSKLEFYEARGREERPLKTIVISEGQQIVALTPSAD